MKARKGGEMYARVATFENRDVSLADQLVGLVRARLPNVAGSLRHTLLLDSCTRSAVGIAFFESDDDLKVAERDFDRVDGEIPEVVRGRRTSVRSYEVVDDETGSDAAAARVSTLACSPYRVRDMLHAVREQILGEASELDGWRGALTLVDLDTGDTKVVTFWASDDALRRSEIRETQLRGRVAAVGEAAVVAIDRYDVMVVAVPVAA
jgi:hypothetical protein